MTKIKATVIDSHSKLIDFCVRGFVKDQRDNPSQFTDGERTKYAEFLMLIIKRTLPELNKQLALVNVPPKTLEEVTDQILSELT